MNLFGKAFQSQSIMESMRTMADNGRCVMSVIHQPRSSIFEMFDRLLILSEGSTMYFGDAKNAVAYFSSVGCNCPSNFNPPDFFLDLLSPDNRNANSEVDIYPNTECLLLIYFRKSGYRNTNKY